MRTVQTKPRLIFASDTSSARYMESGGFRRQANVFAIIIAIFVGFSPVIMVLLPWDFGREMSSYRGFMRGNSLPVTLIEVLVFCLALANGFSPIAAISKLPKLVKAGFALFLITAVWTTAFVATSSIIAILGLIKIVAHVMFGLAIVHLFDNWQSDQRNYLWGAIGWGVGAYCLLWVINIVFYNPVGEDWIWLVPTLTNIRWVGFFALASFCAGISLLSTKCYKGANRNYVAIALLFGTIGLTIALWTGTRGAIVAILAAVMVSSLLLKVWRLVALYTLASATLAFAVTVTLPVVHPSYGISRIIGASTPFARMGDISSGRLEIWRDTMDKIAQRPIAGWGIDQFRFSFPKGQLGFRHPHESVLQILFSNGLLGLISVIMIALPFAIRMRRTFSHPHEYASVAYLSGALAYGLYDGFFYYTYPVMIMLFACACLSATKPLLGTDR